MDSTKYQSESDSIHIEMTCECVVFPQKIYLFMHVLVPFQATKSIRTFLLCKRIPILELSGKLPDINPIENVLNITQIGNQMPCKKNIQGREYVKQGKV